MNGLTLGDIASGISERMVSPVSMPWVTLAPAAHQAVLDYTVQPSGGPIAGLTFYATASDGEGGHTGSGQLTVSCSP